MIPKKFVEQQLLEAENIRMFGVSITELSRDELLASLVFSVKSENKQREQHIKDIKFMAELNKLASQ